MTVEVNEKLKEIFLESSKNNLSNGKITLTITPALGEDYWVARVHLYKDQYVLAFPKFFTIGIGFAIESDWNTNFPYTCTAEETMEHIWHNHKYKAITKEQVIAAIKELQPICKQILEATLHKENIKEGQ